MPEPTTRDPNFRLEIPVFRATCVPFREGKRDAIQGLQYLGACAWHYGERQPRLSDETRKPTTVAASSKTPAARELSPWSTLRSYRIADLKFNAPIGVSLRGELDWNLYRAFNLGCAEKDPLATDSSQTRLLKVFKASSSASRAGLSEAAALQPMPLTAPLAKPGSGEMVCPHLPILN